jgi:hypothetical protein
MSERASQDEIRKMFEDLIKLKADIVEMLRISSSTKSREETLPEPTNSNMANVQNVASASLSDDQSESIESEYQPESDDDESIESKENESPSQREPLTSKESVRKYNSPLL